MFSPAYKRSVLTLLTAVYTLNLVDRGLMSLLLQPIKEDLKLSDTQLGLLTGIVFGLFYATLGLPLARWADRGNRVTLTSIAIGLWGLTLMTYVAIGNFAQLALARMAAAVGEAGCKPPAYSLVGDYFGEPAERTRAMSIFWLGSPLAMLISFMAGGWLNEQYGWRMTFFLMGIPGLLLALLVRVAVAEPRRKRPIEAAISAPPFSSVLALLWDRSTTRHLCCALVLAYTVSFGLSPWYGAFMVRSHGMGTAELGFWLGLIFSLGGIAGLLIGGYVANRWFPDDARGQLLMSGTTVALVAPAFALFLLVPTATLSLVALMPLAILFIVFMGPTFALLQRLVPDSMRATMLSLIMLFANLIGMGLGPQLVGILSDRLAPTLGNESLRYAMLCLSVIAFWSAFHFWKAAQTAAADIAEEESQGVAHV